MYKLRDWIDVDKLNWEGISLNPNAGKKTYTNSSFLEINVNKLQNDYFIWQNLSGNPNAISLLENNMDNICWSELSCNQNAISILEKNQEKIDWIWLSGNPNAISLLEKNPYKIDWFWFSLNPFLILKKIKRKSNGVGSRTIQVFLNMIIKA